MKLKPFGYRVFGKNKSIQIVIVYYFPVYYKLGVLL